MDKWSMADYMDAGWQVVMGAVASVLFVVILWPFILLGFVAKMCGMKKPADYV